MAVRLEYKNGSKEGKKLIKKMESGSSNMLVAVRIRPLNEKEKYISDFETIKIVNDN